MACELNQYGNYDVTSVTHDKATNKYVVKLKETNPKCPEGIFASHNLVIKRGADRDFLAYSTQVHAPVLALKNGTAITEIADPITLPDKPTGIGFFGWLLILAAIAGGIWFIRKLMAENEEDDTPPSPQPTYRTPAPAPSSPSASAGPTAAPSSSSSPSASTTAAPQQANVQSPQQPQPVVHEHYHTTVVQQSSGIDPLTAGIVGYELGLGSNNNQQQPSYNGDRVADELRQNRLYEEQRDLDRDRRELDEERASSRQAAATPAPSFHDDSDDVSDDSSSSSSNSSASSDSDSFSDDDDSSSSNSFSDDSGSSFSDDSGSSFSDSDSGSSFSSDDN